MSALDLAVSLLLSLVQGITTHYTPLTIADWVGREYTELPAGLCAGSAETLLGEVAGQEYTGLICTQSPHSYLVLQQLIGHTATKKAILKAINIQTLPPLQQGEFSTNRGCREATVASSRIVAIVRDVGQPTYQTIKAWKANLDAQRFEELDPKNVVCQRPWL